MGSKADITDMKMTKMPVAGPLVDPLLVRRFAGQGETLEMIAARFDLLEDEFIKKLSKDKSLKRAYDLGCVDAKREIYGRLWGCDDKTMTLLLARMKLKMVDPVIDHMSGDALKILLMKMDPTERKTLGQMLGFGKGKASGGAGGDK